ncbi:MAG: hypothetical protein WBD64_08960 [Candidatus Zixiibacteriota bacterium]
MLRRSFVFLVMGTVMFLLSGVSSAEVPNVMNYQGKLTTASGGCVNDTVQMTFTIYDDEFGTTAEWTETQYDVAIKEGVFSVLLGNAGSPIPASVFDGSVKYLGVQVESDPEMRPLKPMGSVAYAFNSATAAPDADWTISGDDIYRLDGNVGVGTDAPAAKLHVTGGELQINTDEVGGYYSRIDGNEITGGMIGPPGTQHLHIKPGDNSSNLLLAEDGGNVGIGTGSPGEKLDVAGTAKVTGFTMPTGAASGYVLTSDPSGAGTWQAAAGGGDIDWTLRITDTADTTLITGGRWGIARAGNVLYGDADSTHVNLGVACITGTSGENYRYSTTGGGLGNAASGWGATVGGGGKNTASENAATVGGGYSNIASGLRATAGGGILNTASGHAATVPGGWYNLAAGDFSLAAGDSVRISSDADYTFAFGRDFTTSTPNAVIFHNSVDPIKVGIGTTAPDEELHVVGNIKMVDGNQAVGYVLTSDANGVGTWQAAAVGGGGWADDGNAVRLETATDSVGIGTATPSEKLEVSGNIKASGTITCGSSITIDGATDKITTTSGTIDFDNENLQTTGNTDVGGFKMATGAGTGKVLTSDASGVGTWQAPAAGGIGGSGTANYVPKFTASTTLGNSAIYETGSRIGIGTTTPNTYSKLHVQHNNRYAGYFTSSYLSAATNVIYSEFTGSGNYNAAAVYGRSSPADGYGYGGYFVGGYKGVYAEVYSTGSAAYCAVDANVGGGSGLNIALNAWAHIGTGTNYGVYGAAQDGNYDYGVYGAAAVEANSWAGYFQGNAKVTGTLTKGGGSFQIDHPLDPENKYLYHSFVESPDMMNVYNGNVILDATGEATIELPDYFEALNMDFRYQLTCIGGFAPVYIAQEISGNQFTIAGGKPGMKVSWQVTGIRHDKFAEANRIQVEVDKSADERGKYLHPQAYGLGEEYDIHYEMHKRMEEKLQAAGH